MEVTLSTRFRKPTALNWLDDRLHASGIEASSRLTDPGPQWTMDDEEYP